MASGCVVVMPVYNEAGCIEAVCREWLAEIHPRGHRLLIVDDGSKDQTPAVLQRLASECPGLTVVHQPNGGHGSAVLRGYREALRVGCEWVFQVDSDGQFRATDFERLWSQRHRSRFILGHRKARLDSWSRRFLSRRHRDLLLLLFGVSPTDPNIPYRLMHAELLESMLEALPPGAFAPNVLLSILGTRAGFDPLNIPVQHLARAAGTSTLRWKTMTRVCAVCLGDLLRFRVGGFRRFEFPL